MSRQVRVLLSVRELNMAGVTHFIKPRRSNRLNAFIAVGLEQGIFSAASLTP